MKLLIATPLYPPEIGGPATYAETLATELPKAGIEVSVLSFGAVRRYPKVLRHIMYALRVFRMSAEADMVLVLDPVSVGLPVAIATLFRPTPFVLKVVGDYAWEQGQQRFGLRMLLDEFVVTPPSSLSPMVRALSAVERYVARRATHIIVPSAYLRSIVMQWGVSEQKITVVYNAFSGVGNIPEKHEARKRFALEGEVIVSAGRLVPWKGFPVLIRVVSRLIDRFPTLRLLIVGDGPDETSLAHMIREHKLEGVVSLLGRKPHDELLALIRGADCFVLNTGYEGLSHQLLEVLALGTPVVTTRVGGNPEIVTDNETGRLVAYNSEEELYSAIEETLRDRKRSAQMAEHGIREVGAWTVGRMVSETLAVLRENSRSSQ